MGKCYYCQNHLYHYEDDPKSWQYCSCEGDEQHCKACHELDSEDE